MQSGGEIMPVHNSIDTVNAAATAILTSGSRRQPQAEPRRKWADRLIVYFCFGSLKNRRRINHSALVPEPTPLRTDAPIEEILNHPPPPVFPFVAPPSSPASFIQSEPISVEQSPSIDAPPFLLNSPSATGPPSIYATGPYAHETEVVSPPVFSAFTTEPSTACFTPPAESVHLTTPSSPEVPYATDDLEFYPNYTDSQIVHLISPSSVYSGTSSPFSDTEIQASSCYAYSSFPVHEPPKILNEEGNGAQKLIPHNMHDGCSLLEGNITEAAPVADFSARLQHNVRAKDHQVSFDLTVEDVVRCREKKTANLENSVPASFHLGPTSSGDHKRGSNYSRDRQYVNEIYRDLPEKVRRSLSLRLAKEVSNFKSIDATNVEPSVGNEKATGMTEELGKSQGSANLHWP
ncbi:unnamed protein product [Urochloa humidicola]